MDLKQAQKTMQEYLKTQESKNNEFKKHISEANVFGKMAEMEKNASPEELKVFNDLKVKIKEYWKKGDFEGLQKYLAHVKKTYEKN